MSSVPKAWLKLKGFTTARVALGRTGCSLPTEVLLQMGLAHANAKDAVNSRLATADLAAHAKTLGFRCISVHSAVSGREEYLRRPDLGRTLNTDSRLKLQAETVTELPELVFVIADGLSAIAVEKHAIPLLAQMRVHLENWCIGPLIVAEQARVGLGDEIGEILHARMLAVLIGERPGLSSPDSLGVYLTYDPRTGRSDAQRNCVSNIHAGGLSYSLAARRLSHLLEGARRLRLTGIGLKDESDAVPEHTSKLIFD